MPLRHLRLLWTCCPGSNGTAAQTKPVWIKVYPEACGRLKSQVEEQKGLSKKEFCGHQTRCCVWQTPNTTHVCKHATPSWSIMMWGCFSAAGPGRLLKVEDKREILEDIQTQSARELLLCRRSVSHQVSLLKHTAKATWMWFKDKVNVAGRPSQSSDFSPIGNLWRFLKRAVHAWHKDTFSQFSCSSRGNKDNCITRQLCGHFQERLLRVSADFQGS